MPVVPAAFRCLGQPSKGWGRTAGQGEGHEKNSQWFKISHRNALLYTESASADLIKLAVRLRLAPYPTVVFDIFNER
jgi:hypothetical protein